MNEAWDKNQKKKEYLNGYKDAKRREKRILEQIQKLRADEMFPCLQYSDMPKGTNISDLSDYAVKLDGLLAELEQERLEAVRQYENIYHEIKAVKDEREREVLVYRYLEDMRWEDICVVMDLSWKHTHRIHGKALSQFEIWKEIEGFEECYEVSSGGRVRKCDRSKILRGTRDEIGGYVKINLIKDGLSHTKSMHRLVATAFLERKEGQNHVHHINENKEDNRAENLMWVSPEEHGSLRSDESKKRFRETYQRNLQKRKAKEEEKTFYDTLIV